MLQSLLKRRFGEHDETDLAREIEPFEHDISKYEQQSSDLISDAIKHGIVCGGMAHHRPVYDHKTGERLSPHLVKVGRQTEHDAMTRHQLFERVPIALARGKKVRCQ